MARIRQKTKTRTSLPSEKSVSSVVKSVSGKTGTDIKNAIGAYDGANWWSTSRGYVYFPTLDSRKDLDSYTLFELRKRSRWLYVNSGFATRCVDGIANMVGSLTPVPQTSDKEWNQLALDSFMNFAGTAGIFDVGGRFNFWDAQVMMTTLRLIDGDILPVLTSWPDSNIAACMFYEAHQVDNSSDTTMDQSQWTDGVRTSPQGRPVQFRVVTGDQYGNFSPSRNGQKSVDIDAKDACFHAQYRRPGRVRGEPALRHAINHLLDRSEIIGFTKASIKNASTIGFQITKQASEPSSMPSLSPPPKGTGGGTQTVTLSNGRTVLAEDVLTGGKALEMDPGEEVKLLLDQRPHPNQIEFLEYLARDISWGVGCSSDILWNIYKLGGATVRYVMADAQQTLIEPAQCLLADQFCSRFWVYFLAKEMKRGALRPCKDPSWWKHDWQPQRKLTVDIGRDGKLYLDMHKSGLISLKRFHSQQGQNWQDETNDYLDERAYIIKAVEARGLTMEQAYPPEPGSANVTVREQADPGDPGAGQPEEKAGKAVAPPKPSNEITPKDFLAIVTALKPAAAPVNITFPEQKYEIHSSPVTVHPSQHTIENNIIPPPQPKIDVHVGTPPAPIVHVAPAPAPVVKIENKIDLPKPEKKKIKVRRDADGHMTSLETE